MNREISNNSNELTPEEVEMARVWSDLEIYAEDLNSEISKVIETEESKGNKLLIFHSQGLKAISATFILLKNNMPDEAAATLRLSLEHLFCAAACNSNPAFFTNLENSDFSSIDPMKAGAISVSSIAKEGHLENLWNTDYKFLSKIGAHANTLAATFKVEAFKLGLSVFHKHMLILSLTKNALNQWGKEWQKLILN